MGSGDGTPPLPPLIDFGDDGATHSFTGSARLNSTFSSATSDPFAACGVPQASPAGSSSSPSYFEHWNEPHVTPDRSLIDQWDETSFAARETGVEKMNKTNASFDSIGNSDSESPSSRPPLEDRDLCAGNFPLDLLSSPEVSSQRRRDESMYSPFVSRRATQTPSSDSLPFQALESMALNTPAEGNFWNFHEPDFRSDSSGVKSRFSSESRTPISQSCGDTNPPLFDTNNNCWASPLSLSNANAAGSVQRPSFQDGHDSIDLSGNIKSGTGCGHLGPANADTWQQSPSNFDLIQSSQEKSSGCSEEFSRPSLHEGRKFSDGQNTDDFRRQGQENIQVRQTTTMLSKNYGANGGQVKEFKGAGSQNAIDKAHDRDDDRPMAFELRPQPYKVSPIQPSGVLACTDYSLWLASVQGFLVWDITSAFKSSCDGPQNFIGDEDAAAYDKIMHGFATTCMFADTTNNLMWSGHDDGKARAWPLTLERNSENAAQRNAAIFSWQAHQAPVLAMVVSSNGELWTGSEGGSLRVWSHKALANAFSSSQDSRLVAASFLATSYVDLKARGLSCGASSLLSIDMRFLVAEHSQCRVWSGGSYLLALWDARTKELLKVVTSNADPEFLSPNVSPVREIEKVNVGNTTKVLKKEKSQGTLSFFQRSRNAVMGAADAVLRATVGQSIDDSKRMEALVSTSDGNVWVGYANGRLGQWDSCGYFLADHRYSSTAIGCMCSFGNRIFVGYVDGVVHALAMTSGKLVGAWCAHRSPIAKLGVSNSHLFSLADNGGIRGWFIAPRSHFNKSLLHRMKVRESTYSRQEKLKLLAGTWNVGQEKASFESLKSWLSNGLVEASIIAIGLQEVEMGAGALAIAAAKETVGLAGSANGQWWLASIEDVLNEKKQYARAGSRQLAGLLIGVWVTKDLAPYIGDVDVSAVACGFGRAFGNKGAVAVKLSVFRRTICVVNCHFAAHVDGVARRNADFDHIYHRMSFGRSFGADCAATCMADMQGLQSTQQDILSLEQGEILEKDHDAGANVDTSELSEVDLLIWMGDLNYRLADVSYSEAVGLTIDNKLEQLLKKDQLRLEMKAGRVFQEMREAHIMFPPTYKFDKGSTELEYDSSDKKRVPAWCDRILFRDSFCSENAVQKLSCPPPIIASASRYQACLEAIESDHKPVFCLLEVQLAVIIEAARRWEYGKFLRSDSEALLLQRQISTIPSVSLHTKNVVLANKTKSKLKISNDSTEEMALFSIHAEGKPLCSTSTNQSRDRQGASTKRAGLPLWLQVLPSSGVILPRQTAEVTLQYTASEEKSTVSSHSKRPSEAVLVVSIKGAISSTCEELLVKVCRSTSTAF